MSVYSIQHGQAFEWDARKDERNQRKHGVAFRDAASAFRDGLAVVRADPDHSDDEDRFLLLGRDCLARVLVIVHCVRGNERDAVLRIISARRATPRETATYWSRAT